jgi:YD repeat-containing protein
VTGWGNTAWFASVSYTTAEMGIHVDERVVRSYYGADEKLRAADTRRCISTYTPPQSGLGHEQPQRSYCLGTGLLTNETAGAFEWYRYDALGRRILVRARRDHSCTSFECNNTITRFVWDGDQILAEIRGDGTEQWTSAELENDKPVAGEQFGRVLYIHGGGIEAPLAIIRMGDTDVGEAILPIANWRGTFVTSTDVNGRKLCPPPTTGYPCIVTWAGAYGSMFYTRGLATERIAWWEPVGEPGRRATATATRASARPTDSGA